MMQLRMPGTEPEVWERVTKWDARAVALADRHYSRQQPGSPQFLPPGRTLVLLTPCGRAVWGVVENVDPVGEVRWRVAIFRNEGAGLSSELVSAATARTRAWWSMHYGGLPSAPLRTEVDATAVRRKRDPGRCFLRAGWRVVGAGSGHRQARGLVVMEAPS